MSYVTSFAIVQSTVVELCSIELYCSRATLQIGTESVPWCVFRYAVRFRD